MNKLVTYFESIGFKPNPGFRQDKWSIAYQRGDEDDWCLVTHRGKGYDAEYVRVYSANAIRVSKYSSTRMADIIDWIERNR